MKSLASLAAVLGAAIILLSTSAAPAMTIKLGVVTKPGSAQNIVADKFKELVE